MEPELKTAVPLTDVIRTLSRIPERVTIPVDANMVLLDVPEPRFEEYPYERFDIATIAAKPFAPCPVVYPFIA